MVFFSDVWPRSASMEGEETVKKKLSSRGKGGGHFFSGRRASMLEHEFALLNGSYYRKKRESQGEKYQHHSRGGVPSSSILMSGEVRLGANGEKSITYLVGRRATTTLIIRNHIKGGKEVGSEKGL